MPDANTLTVGIFAIIAQHERETIAKRTKDALAAKKARGEVLGRPENLRVAAITKSLLVRQVNAVENPQNRQAKRLTVSLHRLGLSLQQIATEFNEAGFRTRRGQTFLKMSVVRVTFTTPSHLLKAVYNRLAISYAFNYAVVNRFISTKYVL